MNANNSYNSERVTLPTSPIYLLHGWGMNKNIWQPFIASLPKSLQQRVTALDLPGFGSNKTMPKEYDLQSLSDWLSSEIHQPSIVLGWSLGGLVAQHFAKTYSQKVIKLGLIASSPKFMASDTWQGIKPEILSMFAEQLSQNHEQTIERFLAIQAMGATSAKQDIKEIRDLVLSAPTPNIKALSEGLELLKTVDLTTQFSESDVNTSAIFGRLDSLVPIQAAKDMQTLNSGLDITVIDKASHAPFISHPTEFTSWFASFVN